MKIAFINLKNHPRGNYVLEHLTAHKFHPTVVIEENSSLAIKNRQTLKNDLSSHHEKNIFLKKTKDIVSSNRIRTVENHNSVEVEQILEEKKIDIGIIGDTRILKKNIFSIPKNGIINIHPGLLPEVRGNTPYIWAAHIGEKQGVTVHYIDDGIDTGPILDRKEINMSKVKCYHDLLAEIFFLCSERIVYVLRKIQEEGIIAVKQAKILADGRNSNSVTFTLAPHKIKIKIKEEMKIQNRVKKP